MKKRSLYFSIPLLMLFSTLHAYKIELYHAQPHLDKQLMSIMKNEFNIQSLIETGTWNGLTALAASEVFSKVYTVEIHFPTFKNSLKTLKTKKKYLCMLRRVF